MKSLLYVVATILVVCWFLEALGLRYETVKYVVIIPTVLIGLWIAVMAVVGSFRVPPAKYSSYPRFARLEIPGAKYYSDLDIEAEYRARVAKLKELADDDSVSEEKYNDYVDTRLRPFHPVEQYWDGTKWRDKLWGKEYPEYRLCPRMISPSGQFYDPYSCKWYDNKHKGTLPRSGISASLKDAAADGFLFGAGFGAGANLTDNIS